ncbi:MAG: ArsA-related P-loop ATPase [Acidimicrobiia bacterium]|nr:ArsA-related P-loop ATPase [Acidimicrobiia bacterium]
MSESTATPADAGKRFGIDAVMSDAAVVVCCGSGGVGKTTSAAVLGLEGARRGRRVVVVTIDPARRLADALGLPGGLSGDPQRIDLGDATPGEGELWAMMLDTAATFDGLVQRYAADDSQIERILGNPFYRNMASALSGTQEYMAAEKLHELHGDERFDLVIVDTPPSRSALDFLEAPGVLARFLDHRLFRLLMLPTRTGLKALGSAAQPVLRAIGRVVGSDVLADTVAFFQAFSGMESGFRERANEVVALIRSPETAFVIIASPRHDTIEEAVWFGEQLVEQQVDVAAAIVNRTHPEFGQGTSLDARDAAWRASESGEDALAALWANVAELRTLRERELAVLSPLVDIAGADQLATMPLLDRDVHDLEGLRVIADHLFSSDVRG